jgi:hypothetical protein
LSSAVCALWWCDPRCVRCSRCASSSAILNRPDLPWGMTSPKSDFQHRHTTMLHLHLDTPDYFTLPIATSHYSFETPSTSPWLAHPSPPADPHNPLLALRSASMASPGADVSRLLQLQTQAAHRPATQPLQQPSTSSSPTNSDSSITSTSSHSSGPRSALCCCRCRREYGHSGMFQFGTNLYYCSHCARMVGYSTG